MKDFMNVRQSISIQPPQLGQFAHAVVDVLQPCPKVLQRLRKRFHQQESVGQGGGVRDAMRRQVSQELREVRREISGAER